MAPHRQEHARARRAYGQNFLIDPGSLRRVVAAAGIRPGDLVYEVGAGRGHLTAELARRTRRLVAYEVDPELAAALPDRPGVAVRAGDFLRAAPPAEPFRVVGNIPYALTSAVVEWCLDAPALTTATLVTQLEYARKRTGDYGRWSRLTIRTWPRHAWELSGRLPRTAFRPVPRVDGGILRLRRRPVPLVPDLADWQRFVDLGFTGLGGSLQATLTGRYGVRRTAAAFRAVRLAPDVPVGRVWPEQWLTLYRLLSR
ncbi:ErmE/ErmH/ErmO/ErmR family 23S rRNA (adenine(2058)-N(6))-methyltransferase [Couchioplanes caeruleus]|uniref:ErmE/ErmH/ErmO/ErmR family 23S rRNA (adenine(2058)-N(6))-methyltransferase n=1 Tax=Couchioplanes caeruleus TaxID=56438 RepID=UPI0020BEACB5|nr:ErmE/ErmH/ErmO/ErmR family 23S rRNA (adenine(2058)-N(6))-methyltransferase [Couchioplanes caeruleus]UQU64402.1 ErmE/ErmH/ErmO/ErmR family 23S rRNA (adenine(2058)-N(6))-methyltransferase [Couchioplanes caeruleus]